MERSMSQRAASRNGVLAVESMVESLAQLSPLEKEGHMSKAK
jgi:hypothetical protein